MLGSMHIIAGMRQKLGYAAFDVLSFCWVTCFDSLGRGLKMYADIRHRRASALRRGIEAAIQFVDRIRIHAGLHRDVDERHGGDMQRPWDMSHNCCAR